MKHALEIRVPFLDHRLVEFVLGLDDLVKFPNEPKQLLVESMDGIIPSEVVNRPKMGFTFPWAYWMKTDLLAFCEEGLDHLKGLRAIDETFLMDVWNKFLNNDSTFTWSRFWPLVVLGHWIKENDIHE
jgi:asparagine synthase (glutamine-hydrolysing)